MKDVANTARTPIGLSLSKAMLGTIVLLAACAPVERAPLTGQADFVRVDKSDRTLTLFRDGRVLREYTGFALGDAPEGHKQFEGDERTPEGRYTIDTRNPASAYHLSLRVSYPNDTDRAFAETQGRSPGGDIFIHGQPNASPIERLPGDWTDGCIAVSDAEMDELWGAIADGTPIEIVP
ncbi:L,D-transpeptidase family protein [Parerythrobacter lacustris]|uniref:L,D-transpeptidase family protein n=1 Tax=Parerythrobacter lacustris TaxID=2969984 RepID=A0ABT1XUN9_9SPHN|nr:L,D-transpeptidase family protein [Parerythrobacter lacustris]MCR2834952.1 L,D-transpeptidase family protein [Parerythrobacter lacustris]